MRLAEWIKREGVPRFKVAEKLGVSQAYVTNLCSVTPSWPSRDLIILITEMTDGEVTADDFLPALPEPRPAEAVA